MIEVNAEIAKLRDSDDFELHVRPFGPLYFELHVRPFGPLPYVFCTMLGVMFKLMELCFNNGVQECANFMASQPITL